MLILRRGFLNRFNKARLGLHGEKYINSGVMLMNLRKIREDFTSESILECFKENTKRHIMGDQDLINILFGEYTVFIDERIYNLDERSLYFSANVLDLYFYI
ncbi:MAG: glycosyltransferase [Eubacteriales bacterium]